MLIIIVLYVLANIFFINSNLARDDNFDGNKIIAGSNLTNFSYVRIEFPIFPLALIAAFLHHLLISILYSVIVTGTAQLGDKF